MNSVAPHKILIVEDDPGTRRLLQVCLRPLPAEQLVAADGAQALELLAEHRVDLVITDLGLPGVSGIEIVQRMRADPRLAAVPVILLSLIGDPDIPQRSHEAGAQAYFVKPFSPAKLVAVARGLLPA
jgi:two-component system chemotaxis response regulator CheY